MITTGHEVPHNGKKQNGSMTEVLELIQEVAGKKKRRVRRSQSCKMIVQPLVSAIFAPVLFSDCTTTQWFLYLSSPFVCWPCQ